MSHLLPYSLIRLDFKNSNKTVGLLFLAFRQEPTFKLLSAWFRSNSRSIFGGQSYDGGHWEKGLIGQEAPRCGQSEDGGPARVVEQLQGARKDPGQLVGEVRQVNEVSPLPKTTAVHVDHIPFESKSRVDTEGHGFQ